MSTSTGSPTADPTGIRQTGAAIGRTTRPPAGGGNAVLYRNSVWLFAAFAAASIPAFWPRYFARLTTQPTYHGHAHGIVMFLWVALIVAQPWLIRTGRRAAHRRLGRLAYVLVPLAAVTAVNFVHFRVRDLGELSPACLHLLALVLNALPVFIACFALALYWRRTPATHARWMIASLFPIVTPVTDRLIGHYLPSLHPLFPTIGGEPLLPLAGFALADAMLIGLSVWDWQANRRADVFPVALAMLLLYHASVLTFHRFAFRAAFGRWFAGLPLS